MKKVIQIVRWLGRLWRSWMGAEPTAAESELEKPPYTFGYAEELPEKILSDQIYIIQDGLIPELLAFKCPCGCGVTIFLNLLPDTRPLWTYVISNETSISISPSIWRTTGCKSHFFVNDNAIKWV